MPAERSLAASLRVAVVSGVGCNPPSSASSSLSLSPCNLHRRPSQVSARRGPRTRPLTCSLLPPSSTSPSPPSARCRSRLVERSLSASSCVAVICGVVGCDPLSSMLPLHRNLHRRPFPLSASRGPRTRLSTCSSSTPSSTSPSPPSARRQSQDRYGMSCSSNLASLSLPSLSSPRPRKGVNVLALVASDDAMPSILSCNSMSHESPHPRTEEIFPLPPLPRPPSSPYPLISTPPGMLPLKPCSVDDPTRAYP